MSTKLTSSWIIQMIERSWISLIVSTGSHSGQLTGLRTNDCKLIIQLPRIALRISR
jgi:hypothetical protein